MKNSAAHDEFRQLHKYGSDPNLMLPGLNSGWDAKTKFQNAYTRPLFSESNSPPYTVSPNRSPSSSRFSEMGSDGSGLVFSGYKNPYIEKELRKKNYVSGSLYF